MVRNFSRRESARPIRYSLKQIREDEDLDKPLELDVASIQTQTMDINLQDDGIEEYKRENDSFDTVKRRVCMEYLPRN